MRVRPPRGGVWPVDPASLSPFSPNSCPVSQYSSRPLSVGSLVSFDRGRPHIKRCQSTEVLRTTASRRKRCACACARAFLYVGCVGCATWVASPSWSRSRPSAGAVGRRDDALEHCRSRTLVRAFGRGRRCVQLLRAFARWRQQAQRSQVHMCRKPSAAPRHRPALRLARARSHAVCPSLSRELRRKHLI